MGPLICFPAPSSGQGVVCVDSRGGLWVHVAPEGSLGISRLWVCALRPGNVLTRDCIVPSLMLLEAQGGRSLMP